MSISFNGTNISPSYQLFYNGTPLSEVWANGTKVWQKSQTFPDAGFNHEDQYGVHVNPSTGNVSSYVVTGLNLSGFDSFSFDIKNTSRIYYYYGSQYGTSHSYVYLELGDGTRQLISQENCNGPSGLRPYEGFAHKRINLSGYSDTQKQNVKFWHYFDWSDDGHPDYAQFSGEVRIKNMFADGGTTSLMPGYVWKGGSSDWISTADQLKWSGWLGGSGTSHVIDYATLNFPVADYKKFELTVNASDFDGVSDGLGLYITFSDKENPRGGGPLARRISLGGIGENKTYSFSIDIPTDNKKFWKWMHLEVNDSHGLSTTATLDFTSISIS